MSDDKRHQRADRLGRLAELATRNRYDPEKLAAIKRSISGKTRCPQCEAVNPAGQETCDCCGSRLYPELRKKKETAKEK